MRNGPSSRSRGKKPTADEPGRIDRGSGNVFADLGLPNAEEHQLKASFVVQLHRVIKARKLTHRGHLRRSQPLHPEKTIHRVGGLEHFKLTRRIRPLVLLSGGPCLMPLAWIAGITLDGGLPGIWSSVIVYAAALAAAMSWKFARGTWKTIRI